MSRTLFLVLRTGYSRETGDILTGPSPVEAHETQEAAQQRADVWNAQAFGHPIIWSYHVLSVPFITEEQ